MKTSPYFSSFAFPTPSILRNSSSVIGRSVSRDCGVSRHRTIAVRVVSIRAAIVGQLIRRIILERRDRRIDVLLSESVERVVRVGGVFQAGAGTVLVPHVREPAAFVVGEARRANLGRAGRVGISRDAGQLVAHGIVEVVAQRGTVAAELRARASICRVERHGRQPARRVLYHSPIIRRVVGVSQAQSERFINRLDAMQRVVGVRIRPVRIDGDYTLLIQLTPAAAAAAM